MTDNTKHNTPEDKLGWYFLISLLVILITIDIANWNYKYFYYVNYHSYVLGFLSTFILIMLDQTIIDKNSFGRLFIYSAALFFVILIKEKLTTFSIPSLFAAALPIIYLTILRALLFILFQNYPNESPTIIQFGRGRNHWKGKENGYLPNKNEKILSYVSYYLPFIIAMVIGVCASLRI